MLLPFAGIHMYHQCDYVATSVATDVTLYHLLSANEAGRGLSSAVICPLFPGLMVDPSLCLPPPFSGLLLPSVIGAQAVTFLPVLGTAKKL